MKSLLPIFIAFAAAAAQTAPSQPGAAVPDTFKAPTIAITWLYDTAKSVRITVHDSSNGSTSFLLYRADSLTATFQRVSQTVSANPLTQDSVIIFDSSMEVNSWNLYKVAAVRNGDTLSSAPCTTYIYKDLGSRQTLKFTKVGNFPVADTAGWSALVGDSLYLKENTTAAGQFAVINLKNPAAPVSGTIDSTSLLNYPMNTLIPVFIKYGLKNAYGVSPAGVFRYQDNILLAQTTTSGALIKLMQVNGSALTLLDSFSMGVGMRSSISGVQRINDSTFYLLYYGMSDVGFDSYYFLPFKISSARLIQYTGSALFSLSDPVLLESICGLYNNKILMASGSSFGMQVFDLARDALVSGGIGPNTGLSPNSGHWFNSTMYFSDDTPYVYASDVRDVAGRTTASANNALSIDTGWGARQNLLIDTTRKLLFILYKANLSTFSYATTTGTVGENPLLQQSHAGIIVLPGSLSSGVTIVLKGFSGPSELSFYDVSGRMIDKMTGITANAVRWRPVSRSPGCYIVFARCGAEKYAVKFLMR